MRINCKKDIIETEDRLSNDNKDFTAEKRRLFGRTDIIIVVSVLLLAAVSLYIQSNSIKKTGLTAIVMKDGKVYKRILLDKVKTPYLLDVSGKYTETLLVENGRIRFKEATCPDKLCVSRGWLTEYGHIAICLPNKVLVKIEGSIANDSSDDNFNDNLNGSANGSVSGSANSNANDSSSNSSDINDIERDNVKDGRKANINVKENGNEVDSVTY